MQAVADAQRVLAQVTTSAAQEVVRQQQHLAQVLGAGAAVGRATDADMLVVDVSPGGRVTLTQTTGVDLPVAVNGTWGVAKDRERLTVDTHPYTPPTEPYLVMHHPTRTGPWQPGPDQVDVLVAAEVVERVMAGLHEVLGLPARVRVVQVMREPDPVFTSSGGFTQVRVRVAGSPSAVRAAYPDATVFDGSAVEAGVPAAERRRSTGDLDQEALAAAHLAVEDMLVDLRERRISRQARNGLVILERDGSESSAIRLGTRDGLAVGIRAYLKVRADREAGS